MGLTVNTLRGAAGLGDGLSPGGALSSKQDLFQLPPSQAPAADLAAREAQLEQRLASLEETFASADAKFKVYLDQRENAGGGWRGGAEAIRRLDAETDEDRSWNDFAKKNLDWAMTAAWPDAPAEVRAMIDSRWRFQQEIEGTRRALYKVRGDLAGPPGGIIEGLVTELLGLIGLRVPSKRS